jgi:hypothetical protein
MSRALGPRTLKPLVVLDFLSGLECCLPLPDARGRVCGPWQALRDKQKTAFLRTKLVGGYPLVC